MIPYLIKHLDNVWAYYGYYGRKKKHSLLELAHKEGWWDLWSVLVRKGDNDQYNKEVLALIEDRSPPEELIFQRLVRLSGASSEWNWGRFAWQQIQQLKDKTAVALYERFPELVRGPFRKHLILYEWGERCRTSTRYGCRGSLFCWSCPAGPRTSGPEQAVSICSPTMRPRIPAC